MKCGFPFKGAIFHGNLKNVFAISNRIKVPACLGCLAYEPMGGMIRRGFVRRYMKCVGWGAALCPR